MRIVLLLLFTSHFSFSQNFGFSAGFLTNRYFYSGNDDPDYKANYIKGYGYKIDVGFETKKFGVSSFMFRLGFEHFTGGFKINDYSSSSLETTEAEGSRMIYNVGVYPLNVLLGDKFEISIGGTFNVLIYENFKGIFSTHKINETVLVLNSESDRITALYSIGINLNLGYRFKISETWSVVPSFNLHVGLVNEFDRKYAYGQSTRQFFGVGLKRDLSK